MKAFVKFCTVLAGYVAAVLVANAAVAVRVANTSGPEADASSGMYAFGDGLLFIAVFSAVALFPTGLALFFLRPFRWFWIALSITVLAIAGTGVLAASVCILASYWTLRGFPLELCAALAVLRTLAAPLLAGAFVLSGVIAPSRRSRWMLFAAAGIEGAVATSAILQWFAGCCYI
jgi:cytochrome b subunit of formate dehydrogenase